MKRYSKLLAFAAILALISGCTPEATNIATSKDGAKDETSKAYAKDGYYCSHRQILSITKDDELTIGENTGWSTDSNYKTPTVDVEQLGIYTNKVKITKEMETGGTLELAFVIKKLGDDNFAICDAYYRGYIPDTDGKMQTTFDATLTGGYVIIDDFNLAALPYLYNSGEYKLIFTNPSASGTTSTSITLEGTYFKASGTNRSE